MCNNYTLVLDVSCLRVCHFRILLECRERSFAMCQQMECVDTEMEPPSDICLPRTRITVSREQSRPAAHVEFTVTTFVYGTNYFRVLRDPISVSVIAVLIQISKELTNHL